MQRLDSFRTGDLRIGRVSTLGCLFLLTACTVGLAGEFPCSSLIIRGQSAGQLETKLLLFGEIEHPDGTQIGSYFEKFQPTKVDAQTRVPLQGEGESLFRLPGGTIATRNTSQVVGKTADGKSLRVKTTGDIVGGTGAYADLKGRFETATTLSPTFQFETRVSFTFAEEKLPAVTTTHCCKPAVVTPVMPACYERTVPSCSRPCEEESACGDDEEDGSDCGITQLFRPLLSGF